MYRADVTESSSVIALLGGAGTEKSRLEEKQRKARKDRKQTSVEWQPRYGFMLDDWQMNYDQLISMLWIVTVFYIVFEVENFMPLN